MGRQGFEPWTLGLKDSCAPCCSMPPGRDLEQAVRHPSWILYLSCQPVPARGDWSVDNSVDNQEIVPSCELHHGVIRRAADEEDRVDYTEAGGDEDQEANKGNRAPIGGERRLQCAAPVLFWRGGRGWGSVGPSLQTSLRTLCSRPGRINHNGGGSRLSILARSELLLGHGARGHSVFLALGHPGH